jgi:hypothetical protein
MSSKTEHVRDAFRRLAEEGGRALDTLRDTAGSIAALWRNRARPFYEEATDREPPCDRAIRTAFNDVLDDASPPCEASSAAPSDGGADSWSEVDRSQLEELEGANTTCTAWIDWRRGEYVFDLPASNADGLDDIPFAEVDAMVRHYVDAGAGWSRKEVASYCNTELRRDMSRPYVIEMFKALGITKKSIPYAPHHLSPRSEEDPEELADGWRDIVEAEVEAEYRTDLVKHWKSRAEELKREALDCEKFIEELIAAVDDTPPTIDTDALAAHHVDPELPPRSDVLLISDWHVGKEVDLPDNRFDADVAERRVDAYIERLLMRYRADARPVDEIVVALLGDLIDGPAGDMHAQQWLGQDIHNLQQLETAATLIAKLATALDAYFGECVPIRFEAIGGNHGRGRQDASDDPYRLPELAMYALARAQSPDRIDWTIHDDEERAARTDVRNCHVALAHGDDTPRDAADLGRVPGVDHALVATGHGHESETRGKLDGRVLTVQNGCLCGVTSFDRDRIGRHVEPVQQVVEIDDHGPVPGPLIRCRAD